MEDNRASRGVFDVKNIASERKLLLAYLERNGGVVLRVEREDADCRRRLHAARAEEEQP